MMKKLLAAVLLGSVLMTAGCGTAHRLAKDLVITVCSPAIVLYGAGTDGVIDAKNIQAGLDGGDAVQVIAYPFAFVYRVIDHTVSCAIHALDLIPCLTFFWAAELHPDSDIRPLQIYKGTFVDDWFEASQKQGDPATGEDR